MIAPQPTLSYCDVGDRLIFLDLRKDRYFCLAEDVEQAFRKRLGSEGRAPRTCPFPPTGTSSSPLFERPPVPCCPPAEPNASLWDGDVPHAGATAAMAALLVMARVRARLSFRGLVAALARIDASRRTCRERPADRNTVERLTAPFAAISRLVSLRDACLPHSLAVAERLIRAGQPAQIVFGVRLGPFAAHCWVQQGGLVVNDRVEIVRTFTPILVA